MQAMQSSGASLTLGSGCRAQVRQHTSHKRTFFFLEQLILKHSIDQTCISIKEMHEARTLHGCPRSPLWPVRAIDGLCPAIVRENMCARCATCEPCACGS